MSQSELARLVNRKQSTVSAWERGQRVMTLDRLYRIASIFNVPVCSLLPENEAPDTPDPDQVADALERVVEWIRGTGEVEVKLHPGDPELGVGSGPNESAS